MKRRFIIGVDEVGRGPLAGPVTVAAILIPNNKLFNKAPIDLRDSKKYSPHQRLRMFHFLNTCDDFNYEISSVFPSTIDNLNIYNATVLAATRSVEKIVKNNALDYNDCKILLDGSMRLRLNGVKYKSVVGGDSFVPAIQGASIIAKVKRDTSMNRYHRMYPVYGFDKNKGYGTKQHIKAIKKYGFSRIHRKSFKLTN